MNGTVYLAGPISGLSYGVATGWRKHATEFLKSHDIVALDPMRAKEYLSHIKNFAAESSDYAGFSALSSNRGITTRDRFDATRCDVLLVNLLGATEKSVGTIMEIAWADLARTPIVCAIEDDGNPHEHGMISEAVGFRVRTFSEALHIVTAILVP